MGIKSFLVLVPLVILELKNQVWKFNKDFPYLLFLMIWFNQYLYFFVLKPLSSKTNVGKNEFVVRMIFGILLGMIWYGVVSDQWPCFVGVPNCD